MPTKTKTILCLETKKRYTFVSNSSRDALEKLIYYLNLTNKDENARIQETDSGFFLFIMHNGNTYAIANDERKEK